MFWNYPSNIFGDRKMQKAPQPSILWLDLGIYGQNGQYLTFPNRSFVIIELNIIVNKPRIVIFLIEIPNSVWWEHFQLSSEDLCWSELAGAVCGQIVRHSL
jgi:hypothetical protein